MGRTDVWVIITESVFGWIRETADYCTTHGEREKLRSSKSSVAHIFKIAKDIPIGHSFSESWSPAAATNRFGLWSNFLHRFDCPRNVAVRGTRARAEGPFGPNAAHNVRCSAFASIESKVSLFCIAICPLLSANIENYGQRTTKSTLFLRPLQHFVHVLRHRNDFVSDFVPNHKLSATDARI